MIRNNRTFFLIEWNLLSMEETIDMYRTELIYSFTE